MAARNNAETATLGLTTADHEMRQISRRALLLVLVNAVLCGWCLPIIAETLSTVVRALEPGRAAESASSRVDEEGLEEALRIESPVKSPQPRPLDSPHRERESRHFGGRGGHNGGGFGGARGRPATGRRPRQSEAATFFNSLDENSDGVLAKEEIREFVEEVGGSTLDDTSEIWGGVSKVMGRLDTDNEEGIGLKELSTWINNLGSILTVEEAADWVTHAVQLPEDVAEAFRSNSVSGYDFPELIENNGEGLHFDLGIKWNYRKRIVKAIEIRLLGLGDEPLAPVMKTPSYLGDGKVAIEWYTGGVDVGSHEPAAPDRTLEKDAQGGDDIVVSPPHPRGSHRDCEGQRECGKTTPEYASSSSGTLEVAARDETLGSVVDKVFPTPGGVQEAGMGASSSFTGEAGSGTGTRASAPWPQVGRAATFSVHKYVLQRSCFRGDAGRTSKSQLSSGSSDGGRGGSRSIAASEEGGHSGVPGVPLNELGAGGEGWITVHEAYVGSPTVFVDSGLLPARTYVYRLQAWNLIGHSEPAIGRVTTPSSSSRWSKAWRLIAPWLSTGNSSAASVLDGGVDVAAEGNEAGPGGDGKNSTGFRWTVWLHRVWIALCWIWQGFNGILTVVHAILVLASVSANLMRLRAAYGSEGTGAMVRRNWPIRLLWKISDTITRSRIYLRAVDIVNSQLEHALGPRNVPRDIFGPQINASSTARGNPPTSDMPMEQRRLYRTDEAFGIGTSSEVRGGYEYVQYCKSSYEGYQQGGGRPWAGLSRIEEEAYASSGTAGGVPGNGCCERLARPVQSHTSTGGEHSINRQSPRLLVQSLGDRIGPNGPPVPLPQRPGVIPQRPLPPSSPPGALERGGGYVGQRMERSVGHHGHQADGPATMGENGRNQQQHQHHMQRQQQRLPQQQDRQIEASDRDPSYLPASLVGTGNEDNSDDDGMVVEIRCEHRRRWWFGWGHAKPENESFSNACESERGGDGGAGAGEGYVPLSGHELPRYGGIGFRAGGDNYADNSTSAHGLVTSTGRCKNWTGDEMGSGLGFAEDERPVVERNGSGSSNLSMDFPRPMFYKRSSLSRLALGLRKGEAAGREGWQQEAHFAGECFSCRKKFKVLKRQRHHCSRCQRVFCSKHGFTSHPPVTVCGIPGECICDVCISSASSGSRSVESTDGIDGSVFDATDTARASDRDPVFVLDPGRVDSDVGSIGSSVNAGSMRSSANSRSTRRFRWASPSSLRQLRSRSQRKPGATAADEEPRSTLIVTPARIGTVENSGDAGAVSVTASPSDGSPAVDARRKDYSRDEQSMTGETNRYHDDGVEAAGPGRSFFGVRRRITPSGREGV